MIEIRSQRVAQGSYGLQRINPENGVRIGHTMLIWWVIVDGETISFFATRNDARKFAREYTKPRGKIDRAQVAAMKQFWGFK